MTSRGPVVLAATLSVFACFLALSAHGQTRPNPPRQICVNGQCASTPVTTPPPSGASSGKIKWNPGHYMASYTVLFGGRSASFVQTETDDLNNQDAIVGYRMLVTWAALEPTEGNYDFSAIDATLQRLKTAYNKPKHLVIMLWHYGHTHTPRMATAGHPRLHSTRPEVRRQSDIGKLWLVGSERERVIQRDLCAGAVLSARERSVHRTGAGARAAPGQ